MKKFKKFKYRSLEKQGNNIGAIINNIYTSDNLEVNDIDFFEVIVVNYEIIYSLSY